jgi:excinuclease ABC subunit C
MNIPIIGLKKDNHHNTQALLASEPIKEIPIPKNSDLFHYLERMQDEVHNYTISYHRKLRNKGAFASYLDEIPGIGENRKKALLTHFRSLKNMKEASINDLQEIIPLKEAQVLKTFLENYER